MLQANHPQDSGDAQVHLGGIGPIQARLAPPTYLAYERKVYDASLRFLWQRGRRHVTHPGGIDRTGGLEKAPHGADLLARCPVIGMVVDG